LKSGSKSDIGAGERRIVVYPGMEAFPLKNGVVVLPLTVIGNDILQQR
jgi:hypothetical protein